MPKIIFNGIKKVNLDRTWILTNNSITTNARDKMSEYFKDKNIDIIDINMLSRLVISHYSNFLNELRENIFTIKNYHIEDSGKILNLELEGKYIGYYENTYGDQFIFIGDPDSGRATVKGGDLGWENEIVLFDGMGKVDWVLSYEEILWMSHCYSTMMGLKFNDIYPDFLQSLYPFNKYK